MAANVKYKDSVFSYLFSNPDVLRELYSALKGISLPPETPVTITTLNNVLFMDMVNDISFEIGGKLVVLIEHQSTINPNMGLRLLMYIARVYEKIIKDRNIYASRLIPLPRPEFYVLYNGEKPYPDQTVLKLSEAYEKAVIYGLSENEKYALELIIKVININHGRNERIIQRCNTLSGYSAFVSKVRELETGSIDKEEAIKKAVIYCRNHNILKEFLETNGTEVTNMLMTEWKMEDALDVRFEEGQLNKQEEIARNALAEGVSIELVSKITGLSVEIIRNIQSEL